MNLKVKIFADGADKNGMLEMYSNPLIAGFTTNPTLMRKANILQYKDFALDVLSMIKDRPISFEVFSDEFDEMERQALEIASWGENVYVKIPITNTRAESAKDLISRLSNAGVKQNITAIMTAEQVEFILPALTSSRAACVSVFAGRIADAGVDPVPVMERVLDSIRPYQHIELIWASPREIFNVVQAHNIGCHIITVTNDLLKKLSLIGKDLTGYSLETVQMFYNDAKSAGYSL